jgi:hypothetical protein
MTWKTPKTDWAANDVPGPNDFNRIEGNTLDNHERLNGHDSDIASINSTLSSHNSRISSNKNRLDNIEDGSRLGLGFNASAGNYSVALGFNASAAEDSSVALGNGASAGYRSVALGSIASAAGYRSVALGYDASATGIFSVALGWDASAMGSSSTALGSGASATEVCSTALGLGASAENDREGILGGTGSSSTSKWKVPGSFTVSGTKNFEIPHPKPEKKATHVIRHGAVESPTPGDTLYRWKVQATKDNDLVTIDLPDYFVWLNKDVQIFVTPQGHFGNGYGTLNRETEQLEIHCENTGEYNVLVIGTRNDDHPSVQNWSIKGVEREVGESWTGETYAFSVDEIMEVEEIKEVS